MHALRPMHWQFICNDKGSARWALPFFRPSFFTVIRVMHSQLQHGNEKRVTLRLIRILGDIVGFGKAITISAPINEVLLRRVLTLRFCRFDFCRNLTANIFLTLRHENFSFLVREATARACAAAPSDSEGRAGPDRRAAAGRAFPLGRFLRPGHLAGRSRTHSAATATALAP